MVVFFKYHSAVKMTPLASQPHVPLVVAKVVQLYAGRIYCSIILSRVAPAVLKNVQHQLLHPAI
jgi:hypothetical protein